MRLIIILLILTANIAIAQEPPTIKILSSSGVNSFNIDIADTDKLRSKGLMFRDNIAANYGMLFIFPNEKVINMWMKNTSIALDMIFIDSANIIVEIKHNTTPNSTQIISSEKPALYVLEIKAGISKELGIAKGDKVVHGN